MLHRRSFGPMLLAVSSLVLGSVALRQFPGNSVALAAAAPAKSTPPPSAIEKRLEEATALFKQQRYHKASVLLFDLLSEPLPATSSAQARQMLAECLEAINLPVLAGQTYRDVVRLGPSTGEIYTRALAAWTALSVRMDDTGDLEDRIRRLPPASDPADTPALSYLRGLSHFESGEIDPALALLRKAATPDTMVGRQASYIAALASIKAGKRAEAWAQLEPLTHGDPRGVAGELTAEEVALSARIRDLAVLGMARIRYAEGKYDEASALYARLDTKSSLLARAKYEDAWIGFFQDHLVRSVTELAAIKLGSGDGFVVEADLLAAMFYLRTNQHDLADGVLRNYLDQLYPVRVALRDITRSFGAREDALELTRILVGASPAVSPTLVGEPPPPGAPPAPTVVNTPTTTERDARDPADIQAATSAAATLKPILAEMLRDRDLSRPLARARRCLADSQALERMPSWWRASPLGQSLPAQLVKEERRALEEAGVRFQTGLIHYRLFLSELNVVGLALRREVTSLRLALADSKADPDPYTGAPLPPFDFIHPVAPK